jgi:small subunit ribosomal protein S1
MSSDEALTKGVEVQDESVTVDVDAPSTDEVANAKSGQAPLPAGEANDANAPAASSTSDDAMPERIERARPDSDDESENHESSNVGPLKRRLRLNPIADESQLRARPSLRQPDSGSDGSVKFSRPASSTAGASASIVDASPEESEAPARTDDAILKVEPRTAGQREAGQPKREPVEIPPAVSDIDAEMEAEIEAALASGEIGVVPVSVPSEDSEGESAATPVTEETLEKGTRLTGRIQSFHGDDVFLDLGLRSPGVVPKRQFVSGKHPEVGQLIEVVVDRVDREEGLVLVNLPKGLRKVASNWEAIEVGQIVDCMVTKTNKGGLEVNVGSLRGFLPAGQVDFGFISDLEPYVGQKLRVKIIDANPKKRNLVVSRRDYLKIERKEAEKNLWSTLQEGQVLPGTVKTLKDYGAFIDLGGVDGFLHIGEMSWTRLKHPSEAVKEGQPVEVKVIHLDREKKKISLGMKQLVQNPWTNVADRYPVGKTVSGQVTRVADFGGFVELEPGLEGLIHISELDYKHVRRVGDVLKPGQRVDAKVLEVDADRKRISLSLKALLEKPPEEKSDEELAPSGGEGYQRKRKTPLRGGTGSSGGGGLFGNPGDFK